ncbi:MAG: sensor histidine kinase [Bacteroidia bacterium]|nr:sensor histidine kinase [Bacteroidia bacterium]
MHTWLILLFSVSYLGLLFGIAWWAERRTLAGHNPIGNSFAYALSMAVYCTAWTFYGSVGKAATDGVSFLTIYLGPTLMAPLWYVILRKMILICRSQRINSIADFLAARYGKSLFLGSMATLLAITGIIPYIALQLKAISSSFDILAQTASGPKPAFYQNTAFYVTLILAVFTILFGTRHLDAHERHEGLVAAVAFESLVKLIALLCVGVFVTFSLYQGPGDLFAQAAAHPDLARLFSMGSTPASSAWSWTCMMLISMFAIVALPRQFHVAVVENTHPKHVSKAIWLFPLYLFLINLFVLPLAFAGRMQFGDQGLDGDHYVLSLPLLHGRQWLALLVFIGGLSAATSMVIVSTIALSIMATNNLVIPLLLSSRTMRATYVSDLSGRLKGIRRVIILCVLMLAYSYYTALGTQTTLVSIGLISFVAVAQFAPALLGGLFWRGATKAGAIAGLAGGFLIWAYTLPFPSLIGSHSPIVTEGLFGWQSLRPYALLGLEGLDPISHATFWSLLINALLYVGVSFNTRNSVLGHTQANLFVNIYRYAGADEEFTVARKAMVPDLRLLLHRFLGPDRAESLLQAYARRHRMNLDKLAEAPPGLVAYAERLLSGAIGSASSRLLFSTVVKEEQPPLQEVIELLDENRQLSRYSRELEQKSRELERAGQDLRAANARLQEMDQIKDDFIATVTHELRTPITSIRAIGNILNDHDLPPEKRQEFLGIIVQESERISRLINQVLDLEKMESGYAVWQHERFDLGDMLRQSLDGVRSLCETRRIEVAAGIPAAPVWIYGDRDRLMQVAVNLLSNAIKFCNEEAGRIEVRLEDQGDSCLITIADNGAGIAPEVQPYIFDKFTQFNDHRSGRPQGSGLGLSITRRIVEHHGGSIQVSSEPGKGARFDVRLRAQTPDAAAPAPPAQKTS